MEDTTLRKETATSRATSPQRIIAGRYDYTLELGGASCADLLHNAYTTLVQVLGGEVLYTKEYCEQVRQVERWLLNPHKPWLLLSGGVGTGKTTMLNAIRYLYTMHGCCLKDGVRRGLDVFQATEIAAMYGGCPEVFANMQRSPMLAVDDMGTENVELLVYGNAVTPLTELLQYRYEHRLLTVMTTNLPPRIVGERYGERIADRLRECADIVVFGGKSHRLQ